MKKRKQKAARFLCLLMVGAVLSCMAGCEGKGGSEPAQPALETVTYSNLTDADSRALLSGLLEKSGVEPERLEASLDESSRRGYFYPENIERLRRAEHLAAQKGCTVAQIALAYVLTDELGIFPAVTATKEHHLAGNVAALDIDLTQEERAWLDLRA